MATDGSTSIAGTAPRELTARPGRFDLLHNAERILSRYGALIALAGVLVAVLAVYLPAFGYYFFGDDFIPLADAETKSAWGYVHDTFLLSDATPNWRFLSGLFYLGAYRAFGLDPIPFVAANVVLHLATVALVFWLVRRLLNSTVAGAIAAAVFGLAAAHVPTVSQITAFNYILSAFLLMVAIVTLYEGLERRSLLVWGGASVVAFAAAVAANEPVVSMASLLVLIVAWKMWPERRAPRRWLAPGVLMLAYATIAIAAVASLSACGCTEAPDVLGGGDQAVGNTWIYLGRLLYPIGMEYPGRPGTAHVAAGIALAVVLIFALVRGPAAARLAVVFLALALAPYLAIDWVLAPRYLYLAAVPFSMLVAVFYGEVVRHSGRFAPAASVALVALAVGVVGVQAWQTLEQNRAMEAQSENWRVLVAALREEYPHPLAQSVVVVRGGPLSEPIWQQRVLPSVARLLWDGARLTSVPSGVALRCDANALDYAGGRYVAATDPCTRTPSSP